MSWQEENGNMETLATSELCSSSLPRRLPDSGKAECGPKDMRQIPAAKAGNMAIPFQSEVSALSSNRTIKYTCNVTRTSAGQFSGIGSHHRRG
jgi:hypothetical protein